MKLFYFEYSIAAVPNDMHFSAVLSNFDIIEDAIKALVAKACKDNPGAELSFTKGVEIEAQLPYFIIIPR